MRLTTVVAVCASSILALSASGQAGSSNVGDAERNALAASIAAARESAGGREWDAAFRASFVTRLSALEVGVLRQLAQQGETADLGPYIGYSVRPASNQDAASNQGAAASQDTTFAAMLGQSTQDLVFTPIAPCRVINSVAAPGPIVVPPGGSTTKTYIIRGGIALNPSFAAQGGIPCDVPTSAAAVSVNFTVAGPSQPGHVIVDPSHLAGGLTSTLNFSPAPAGLNLANGVITPLCDYSVSACTTDIKVTVAFGTTHFLADITGYFSPPTGSISVASGGTGQVTLTTNAIIYGQGTSAVGTAVGVAGQVLAGAAGPPVWTGSPSLSGTLTLVNPSTSTAGNIFKGINRFIHNFGTANTFVGELAGNFTTSGSGFNTAVGVAALQGNTTGFQNTASGAGALQNNTTGFNNTASGLNALANNTTGSANTAHGMSALVFNTTANKNTAVGVQALASQLFDNSGTPWDSFNTAVGYQALFLNQPTSTSTGVGNTAIGASALAANTTGNGNTASGENALISNVSGGGNTADGLAALFNNTTGGQNTGVGGLALVNNASGSSNIGIGFGAGQSLTTGSFNIDIGHNGAIGEAATIRIGSSGNQTRAFIAGISGVMTAGAAVAVLVDASGQLGTVSSSRRFKDDIADMGDASGVLMKMRPVTFHYRSDQDPAGRRLQYGLIAEEVAELTPGLVARSADGQIETVMYQFLPPMLLNEVQKQQRTIQAQAEQMAKQAARLAELELQAARVTVLESEIASLRKQGAAVTDALQRLGYDKTATR